MLKVINTYIWFHWHLHIFVRFNKAVLVTFRSSRVSSWNAAGRRAVCFDKISLISSNLEQVGMNVKKLQRCNQTTLVVDSKGILQPWRAAQRDCCVVSRNLKYTHRKQSCSTHFADGSANTSSSDLLRWKRHTEGTIRENKPSSISPESRFQNPLAAFESHCRFPLPCSVESQKVFMRSARGFLLPLRTRRGWRSFYDVAR